MDKEKKADIDRDELVESIRELIVINRRVARGLPLWRSFLNGAASAVGATVGAALVIGILAGALKQLSGFEFLRPTVDKVLPYVIVESPEPSPSPSPSLDPNVVFTPSPSPDTVTQS